MMKMQSINLQNSFHSFSHVVYKYSRNNSLKIKRFVKETAAFISSLYRIVWYIYWALFSFHMSFFSFRFARASFRYNVMWCDDMFTQRGGFGMSRYTNIEIHFFFMLFLVFPPSLLSSTWDKQGLGWNFQLKSIHKHQQFIVLFIW